VFGLCTVQPSLDLKQHLEDRAAKLEKKGLKLQPHVVALSCDIDSLGINSAYYACVHSGVYYCAMEAVDVCMKASFVFGLEYPQAAHSCWSFLQRAVYGINHKYDRLSSKTQELLTGT